MTENLFKIGKLKLWQKYCDIQRGKHPLTYLFWECTLKCNLSCRHCGSSCGPQQRDKDELTTGEIKRVFDSIAEDFNPKQVMVAITGGEPLLREDLFDVMKYAHSLGFPWGMVTNGTLITPRTIEQLKDAGMSTISVSLDGLEEKHNWLRCNKNAFKDSTNALKLLATSKYFDVVEAITCVHQNNVRDLENIYELCSNLGINGWRLFTISPVGRARTDPELFLNRQQFCRLLDFIKNKRRGRRGLKPSFCDEGFLGTRYEGEVRDRLFYCGAGINVGGILYNGDIAACPILPREHVRQGNVRRDRFSKIWDTKYQIFRDRAWRKKGDCADCLWWEFCEGNSLHLWDFNRNRLMLCNYDLINGQGTGRNTK